MITRTSFKHPKFVERVRDGIKLAGAGYGELMNGHGNRVYIQNRFGNNIMRIDVTSKGMKVYGSESRDITNIVIDALYLN